MIMGIGKLVSYAFDVCDEVHFISIGVAIRLCYVFNTLHLQQTTR